ncbi:hypothetical protein C923_00980, partial [Plasmodium falciparum UGT5.1]
MAPQGGGGRGRGSSGEEDAKDFLDKIGQQVYETVKKEAEAYKEALKGDLSNAKFENEPKGQQTENDPCKLDYQYHTNVTSGFGREYPCRTGKEERFSQVHGGECDEKKIRGSNGKSEGACAPFRRLHLCVRNLENISALDKINKDTLLADVCLAAKHEGQSITQDYPKYQAQYASSDFTFTMCTMLARSFADIGDIIRGKDLYRGNNGKDKLEKNLEKIFGHIYEELKKDPTKSAEAKERYKDENGGNYYQLREDWWALNRKDVWKALTCNAGPIDIYFRKTACAGTGTQGRCRCTKANADQVPTYFDYVPQYLRWFEEWAEDFCTKRKHKLENAKEQCRGQDGSGEERYCDFNGYDCKGTASGKHKYLWDYKCAGCLFSCSDFRKWIKNEKNDFKRQKEKYNKEINEKGERKVTKEGTINNIYAEQFFEQLKKDYGSTNDFLNLLNNEKICSNHPIINGKNSVDFTKDPDETFSHTEICEPCPWCGVKKENGKWERKNDHSACPEEELYTPKENATSTKINVLTSGEGEKDIETKLEAFCAEKNGGGVAGGSASNSDSQKLYEEWQCYEFKDLQKDGKDVVEEDVQKVKNAGGLCILEKTNGGKKVKKQKTFNDFFNFWVGRLLNDSIDWRTQLTKCLSEDKLKKCEKGCKSNCECFKKWIEKKEKEWIEVKVQFNKQPDFGVWKHYLVLENILENYYFKNIQKAYGDLKSIQEMKKMIKENQHNPNRSKDDVDALDVLFDHELEEAEDCLDIHEDDEDDDECVEESEKIPNNPCSGTRHRAMVKNVAADMHLEARQQLRNRAGGRKTLRADASKGTYKRGGQKKNLNGHICNIDTNYSNDERNTGEPCTGKDGNNVRFKIGTPWTNIVKKKTTSYKDVFLPPRREHMCTSNLENLDVGSVTENGKAIHSLLGDVLLAAKMDAEKIKEKYINQNSKTGLTEENYKRTICRAIRYSFADLGDIIRGRDMWNKDDGSKKMEGHLVKIFGKIKQELPQNIKDKYKDDENKTPKYKKLREDWWTANRRQVWKSMQCALKSDNIQCRMTPDDYIPQRLRWMTEWAEWFCKMQSQEYDELETQCGRCTRGTCTGDSGDSAVCKQCKNACDKYKTNINKWKQQWNEISAKYTLSYWQAKNDSRLMAFPDDDPDYHQMVHFFKELKKSIKSSVAASDATKSPYATADRYIHQEIGYAGCNVQTQFCKHKNGSDVSRTDTDNDYAFRDKPYDHEKACKCKENKPQPKSDVCTIVKNLLQGNDGKTQIAACYGKSRKEWFCNNGDVESIHIGACMPPRRKSLCIYNLTQSNETNTKEKLRDAFIKCAAIETHFLWKYYKEQNSSEQNELNKGIIPKNFKRWMEYTYGDYRDIFFGNDISNDTKIKTISDNVNKILKIERKNEEEKYREKEQWWKKNGTEIWEGMLCALPGTGNLQNNPDYNNPPEDFAKKPQFLRWMIEWGEEFCAERKKLENNIKNTCSAQNSGDACNNTKHPCNQACKAYEDYVENKKKEFSGQTNNFVQKANVQPQDPEYKGYESKQGEETKQGNDYLLKNCDNYKCDCMDGDVLSVSPNEKPFGKYYNDTLKSCDCLGGKYSPAPKESGRLEPPPPPPPPVIPQTPAGPEEGSPPQDTEQKVDGSEPPATEVQAPATTQNDVNVCNIVNNVFTDGSSLQKACPTKYGKTAPSNWKCIPSGNDKAATDSKSAGPPRQRRDTTSGGESGSSDSNQGSICVPPRRRKLYLGGFKRLTDGTAVSPQAVSESSPASPPATSSGSPSHPLLTAFVESAAIETFFLWDRYKKLNTPQSGSSLIALSPELTGSGSDDSDPDNLTPQQQLQNGEIPPDFLRQMFYTLGDYRDILYSGNNDNNIVLLASGSTKDEKEKMKQLQAKIQEHINSVSQQTGTPAPKPSDKLKSWWNDNAKHIWNGMICALTYNTDTKSGEKLTQNEELKGQLLENGKSTPKNTQYEYDKVKLEDESGAKTNNDTKLKDFVEIPTYFRYLEEWGEEFCRKRTDKLAKVKEKCQGYNAGGHKIYCSGDGHDCKRDDIKHKNMSADPDCPDCYEQCRKYRKWIDMKFEEFHKQNDKYKGEHDKLNGNSNNEVYQKFYEQIKEKKTAAKFLEALKHCKNSEGDEEKDEDKKNNKIDFGKPLQTFSHSTYCKTCPLNGVTCNGSGRGRTGTNGCTEKNPNWKTVFDKIPENGGKSSDLTVEMIDRRGSFIEKYLENSNNSFKISRLFKGIRKQQWECRFNKEENKEVCNLTNYVENIDLNQHTTFKVLLIYWLEDFLYGYYLLKKKKIIEQCKENGENKCSEEFKKHCVCVKEWVEKKKKEWDQIKKHFNNREQEDDDTYNIEYTVESLLGNLIPRMDLVNGKGKINELKEFLRSYECKCAESSQKKDGNEDAIECMLNKLTEKITSCQKQHSGKETNCDENTTPQPDEEDLLLDETENPVTQPNICPEPQLPQEDEDACKADSPQPDVKEEEEEKEEEIVQPATTGDKGTKELPFTPRPRPGPQPKPPLQVEENPFEHPAVIPSLVTSTLAWSVGIGFAAFTYFYLKKKSKPPVDLLRVLNIPKGDYGTPTPKSKNRYIPYASDKYKGKTYIYMEGDSSGDEKYAFMSDTTDVTSSESEYEELDINDIYVPGSPKYKTLIEVVLEPSGNNTTASGNNTTASGNNTTASGNNTTASGNNTTASDTQNDIQNDGIPSNKFTDNEWNTLKDEFISQYLQSEQPNDIPNDYSSGDIPFNTQPNTLYFNKPQEKPFITSIHDRDLYTGEEYNYNVNMTNTSNNIPINRDNNVYSGIDLINDSLNSNNVDIYDEILKRKENELFGTNHPKHTNTHNLTKSSNSDPIDNQLDLFHTWLDRHRDMCEKWENHHERLAKLKEKWENETHSGNTHPSDSNKTLNTDVSIQIHMDNPKPTNEFTYVDSNPNQVDDTYVDSNPDNSSMDTILEDLDKPFNEPYYYDMYDDDIYYDVNDHDTSTAD